MSTINIEYSPSPKLIKKHIPQENRENLEVSDIIEIIKTNAELQEFILDEIIYDYVHYQMDIPKLGVITGKIPDYEEKKIESLKTQFHDRIKAEDFMEELAIAIHKRITKYTFNFKIV